MSQSDSEPEYKTTEDGPIFAYEKLYYDANDKAKIEAMPEVQREEVLAQRSEQLERHEQDLTLRRIVAARAKEEAKAAAKKKRKASAAELDEGQRKSSRQRTKLGGGRAGEASSAIEEYKKKRAEKTRRDAERRLDPTSRRPATPEDNYSDPDADVESDYDYDHRRSARRRSPTPPKDEPLAELNDLQHVRIGRENFAEVCYYPGFEAAVTDCYARVCLGPGRTPGVNEYRLCRIKGLVSGRPYAMTAPNGRPFPVDKYVLAAHGKSEKAWSFLECSMSRFTEDEWRRYRIVLANEDLKLPTRRTTVIKIEAINNLIGHRFSEAEITEKMKKQHDLEATINRTAEKEEIKEQISAARRAEDWDKVDELEEKLTSIIPVKLAYGTTIQRPQSTYVNREAQKLAELNLRNQRLNAENVRKAELAEMRSRRIKKHLAPGVDDLFDGGVGTGSDISRSGTPVNGARGGRGLTPQPIGTPRASTPRALTPQPPPQQPSGLSSSLTVPVGNGTATPNRTGTPTIQLNNKSKSRGPGFLFVEKTDDEIMAEMDLGIEIDI